MKVQSIIRRKIKSNAELTLDVRITKEIRSYFNCVLYVQEVSYRIHAKDPVELLEIINMCEMKNIQVRINVRIDIADEKISMPKDTAVEIIIKQKKRTGHNEQGELLQAS